MALGIDEPIRWYNFWVCFAVALGTISYGYPSAIIGPTLAKPAFLEYMGLGDAKGIHAGKESLTGAMTGVFQAGAVCGIVLNCFIMERWGRKASMVYSSIMTIFGMAGLVGSVNIGMFITFRFFAGAGSWAYLAVTPVYTSELAPAAYRGLFGGLVGVMLGLGYATASYFGLAFYFQDDPTASWRAPLGLGLFWPILVLSILPFVPESPRWLLLKGRHDEAWKIVHKLHKTSDDPDESYVRREFYQMEEQAQHDRTLDPSWVEMFRRPSYRKRALQAMMLAFMGQSTAVLVINNYGPMFYKELGFDVRDRNILQSGRDSIAFLGNILGSLLMDKFGRRVFILTGFAGCIVCLSIEAAMVALYAGDGSNKVGLGVGICALYTFLVFYAAGIDAAGFVWMAEIFPSFLRSKGLTLAITTIALSDIVYLQVTPLAFANLGWKYFLVFICISIVGYVWFYITLPETKGLPLEEIGALFGDTEDIMVHLQDVKIDEKSHEVVVAGEKCEVTTNEEIEPDKVHA